MLNLIETPVPPRPFPGVIAGFVAMAGTWSRRDAIIKRMVGGAKAPRWYEHGSDFAALMMRRYGVFRIDRNGDVSTPDPPLWDGALEGTTANILKSKLQGKTPLEKWTAQGTHLAVAVQRPPANVRWVIVFAHSHAGQVACSAVSDHLPYSNHARRRVILVTIDTPNRWGEAMQRRYDRTARMLNGRWIHIYSEGGWEDKMRWLGARTLPWKRQQMAQATVNILAPDHSSVLTADGPGDVRVWDSVMEAARGMTL